MEGVLVGVFGTDVEAKTALESSLAKKSEADGVTVYHRTDSGRKISFLDDASFPGKVQGYSRIASMADAAFFVFPKSGKLAAPDGELAVLIESFALKGRVVVLDQSASLEVIKNSLRGTLVGGYHVEERSANSSVLDLTGIEARDHGEGGTLVYVDRAFAVKGVGTVALGFVLRGTVSVHDQLRPVGGPEEMRVDVRSIQVNDQDFESVGRGIRVGLSLRGAESDVLTKSRWLDDGTTPVADKLRIGFNKSPFYKQDVVGRELHLQLPGEMLNASIERGEADGEITARLPTSVPFWSGMRVAVVDLNGKGLRVAGGGTCKP
jgi:selenocysteine-specific translation elongation factor